MKITTLVAHYGNPGGGDNEGETTSNCACAACGCHWVAIAPWDADTTELECPRCGDSESIAEVVVTEEQAPFHGMFFVSDVHEGESEIPGCVGMLPVFESFDMALQCANDNADKVGVLE